MPAPWRKPSITSAISRPASKSQEARRRRTDRHPWQQRVLRGGSRAGQRRETRRQFGHDPRALGVADRDPAPDFIERTAAADAQAQAPDARHRRECKGVSILLALAMPCLGWNQRGSIRCAPWKTKRYAPPPANSALLARLVPSSIADDTSACGWIGGAGVGHRRQRRHHPLRREGDDHLRCRCAASI